MNFVVFRSSKSLERFFSELLATSTYNKNVIQSGVVLCVLIRFYIFERENPSEEQRSFLGQRP